MTSDGSITPFRVDFEEEIFSQKVVLSITAPSISFKRAIFSVAQLRVPAEPSNDWIKDLASDAVADWLAIVGAAISSEPRQVEMYIAMAYMMMREVRFRRERKARQEDEQGEMFYREVARELQEAIDVEVEQESFRSDDLD